MIKKRVQCLLIVSFWMVLFFTSASFAEDLYVTGITKITLRTGPGVEHKVIAMLKSGTKLAIVEYQKDWTHVRVDEEKSGWVLSRFLTRKVPDALLVEKLEADNQELMSRLASVEEENKRLTIKNAALIQIEEKYNKLKLESAEFLKLDTQYKKMMMQFKAQETQIETLEKDLDNEPKLWFLIGPGVFIVGLFFGLSTRKKKRSSLL